MEESLKAANTNQNNYSYFHKFKNSQNNKRIYII